MAETGEPGQDPGEVLLATIEAEWAQLDAARKRREQRVAVRRPARPAAARPAA